MFQLNTIRESFDRQFQSLFGVSYYIAQIVMLKIDVPVIDTYYLLALFKKI